jgi:aerobic-type carbon monoxide dehydrogenase small subunit (CoxS/CutS family)
MSDTIQVTINGSVFDVPVGATAAVAVMMVGEAAFRTSVTGMPRGPVCGMGICYECRVEIDGVAHCRSCLVGCRPGMEIRTNDQAS